MLAVADEAVSGASTPHGSLRRKKRPQIDKPGDVIKSAHMPQGSDGGSKLGRQGSDNSSTDDLGHRIFTFDFVYDSTQLESPDCATQVPWADPFSVHSCVQHVGAG